MKINCCIFLLIFFGCSQKKDELGVTSNSLSEQVVLFNIENATRSQIAQALDAVTSCQPKIIAINAIFEENNYTSSDSVLANSIAKARNVVLVSEIKDGRLVSSDAMFSQGCLAQGVQSYGYTDGTVSKFKTYQPWRNETLWTFPTTIVGYFDFDMSEKIMNRTKGDQFYDIVFYADRGLVYSVQEDVLRDLDCGTFKNKIVLFGDLGPTDSDKYPTATTDGETFGTIILANIITSILAGDFRESKE